VRGRFLVKPKANKDLDDYAQYLVGRASLNVALRFLASARETFSLLSTQPQMGWHSRLNNPRLKALLVFRIAGFENMLVLYRPLPAGVEILRVVHGSRNLQALFRRRGEVE
jgi:toxin ParE1/3/4